MLYNPSLDGIRALAIIMVMLMHARAPAFAGGFIGVDVFFVLSGFLITSLLLAEIDASGRIGLGRFYLRRLLRLMPALLAMLAAYILAAPFLWPDTTDTFLQAAMSAFYLSDYTKAFLNTPDIISHTWSLSIEEHFYLLWPLILLAACRRYSVRQLVIAIGVAYIFAIAWRWVSLVDNQSWDQIYYRFDTRLSGLLLGAWLAAARRDKQVHAALLKALPVLLWLPILAILCLRYIWGDAWMLMWGISFAEWATLAVILAVEDRMSTVSAMLSMPPLVWIGRISYGLYLWHYPVFRYLREDHAWSSTLLIGAPISVCLATLSFFTIERFALRWRTRFFESRHTEVSSPAL